MSTLAGLAGMLGDTQPRPWDQAQRSVTEAQTGLMTLADLKAKQRAEQEFLLSVQNDPRVREALFGGSVLGSLGPGGMPATGGAPAPGAMTQQTVLPGQPPSAPQTVPGGQDLSQFATQGAPPPQSTIAALGPAGQPQMQAQRNPVLEMAAKDPRAAFMMQDQQIKAFTTQLTMREKTAEAFASALQGVNSQESYESTVQELMQWAPQQASRLPKVWSKEAVQPFIESAISAKDKATLDITSLKEQTDLRTQLFKERQAAGTIPEYVKGEGPLNAWINTLMQRAGIPRGTTPPPEILEQAQKNVQEGKIAVSASHGTGQIVMTPGGAVRVGKDNQVEVIKGPDGQPIYDKPTAAAEGAASYGDRAKRAHDNAVALEEKGLTPSLWTKIGEALPFGMGNYLVGEDQRSYRQAVNQFGLALLRKESGAAISATEYDMIDRTFFPQPNDSKKQIEAKRQEREAIIKNLQAEGKGAGRTDTQAQPTSQGSTGNTFTDADIAATLANPANKGKTRQQVIDAALAKGLTYKER